MKQKFSIAIFAYALHNLKSNHLEHVLKYLYFSLIGLRNHPTSTTSKLARKTSIGFRTFRPVCRLIISTLNGERTKLLVSAGLTVGIIMYFITQLLLELSCRNRALLSQLLGQVCQGNLALHQCLRPGLCQRSR